MTPHLKLQMKTLSNPSLPSSEDRPFLRFLFFNFDLEGGTLRTKKQKGQGAFGGGYAHWMQTILCGQRSSGWVLCVHMNRQGQRANRQGGEGGWWVAQKGQQGCRLGGRANGSVTQVGWYTTR